MQCTQKGHENQIVQFVCLNDSCKQPLNCQLCLNQFHMNHQEDCLQFKLLNEYIADKYLIGLKTTVDTFQKGVIEMILSIQRNFISLSKSDEHLQSSVIHLKKMINLILSMETSIKDCYQIILDSQKAYHQILKEKEKQIQELSSQLNELHQSFKPLENSNPKIKITQVTQKETTIEQYTNLLKELEKNNTIFSDQDFPPNAQSIGFNYTDQAWARASEFCQGKMKFFCDENGPNVFGENGQVKSNDIVQGTIGNDRLFGIVYLLANHCPKLLEQNFITKKVNKNCIYALKLYQQETEKIIIVDDYVPYNWDYLLHIKLLGKDYSIWIGILEKAIAKMYGSYHQFGHLTDVDLIQAIINVPYTRLNTQDELLLDNIQQEIDKNNFLFVGTTKGEVDNQGLDPMNFYQITDIKEFYHPDLKEIKLLELKCPWGGRLWKGDWSYNSPLLTPELRKQMNYDKEDNGVFYMDPFSLMQHFNFIKSFQLYANRISSTFISCRKKHAVYCKINVHEPSQYFIQLKRTSERDVHIVYKVVVISSENNEFNYETSFMQNHLDTQIDVNLRKGTYILYIKVLWDHQETEDLQFRITGPSIVDVAEIQKIPNLLRIAFDKVAQLKCKQKQIGQQTQLWVAKYEFDGWTLFIVENPFEKLISLRFQCVLENAKLSKPHSLDNFKQQLPPKSYFTILIKKYYNSVVQINPQIIE